MGRWDAIARAGFAAAALVALALLAHRAGWAPEGRLVTQDASAPWILPELEPGIGLRQWGRADAPAAEYRVEFALPDPAPRGWLELRAFGDAELWLNDASVAPAGPAPRNWRRFRRYEVSDGLRPGSNVLRVRVANRHGPPLLSLRFAADGVALATGPHWRVRLEDGRELPAALARDDRVPAEALQGPSAPAALRALAAPLLGVAAAAALALGWLHSRAGAGVWRRLPGAALGAVAALWLALFAAVFTRLPLIFGFDAPHHLRYVEWLRATGALPLPTDGWSMYHPPLFYALSAGAAGLADALGAPRALALKLLPWLVGLAHPLLALVLVRRLLPGRPGAAALAVLVAGLLPMNLLSAAHFSNEGLHAALAGLALVLAALGLLSPDGPSPRRLAMISLLLGLAVLTKFTALLVAAVAGVALAARALACAPGLRAFVLRGLALALPALLVAGWFYARNVALYGRPLVGNWDLPGPGMAWWSPPGFHTPAYYLAFGTSLARPYLSGFASFWDCLYSTLFADGFLSARMSWSTRPPWSSSWMAAGVLLALPLTAALVWGLARSAWLALRADDGGRRAAFGLLIASVGAFGFALLHVTLALPYHGQARASYALCLTPVLACFVAVGASDLDRRLAARAGIPARVAFGVSLALALTAFARSFLPGP